MPKLRVQDSVVVIIDVQEKLLNAVFNKELCAKKAAIAAKAASILGIPVIVTEQYPKGLGEQLFLPLKIYKMLWLVKTKL